MTRGEAWRSSVSFLLITTISLGISCGSFALAEALPGGSERHPTLMALFFMAFLGVLLGIGGALYLLVAGAFRPATMYRWHEDPLSKAEFLKAYEAADRPTRALIFRHPSGDFEVVTVTIAPPGARQGIDFRVIDGRLLRSLGSTASLEEAEIKARAVTAPAAEQSSHPI